MKELLNLVTQHKSGKRVGIYSVCSAHPLVLEAALKQCLQDGQPVLIESTSNQVNQFGGYTGMTPIEFRELVFSIAESISMPLDKILLGGDHLGPNCWQSEPAASAMSKSEDLIRSYIEAGFRKIHLDCSMPCSDDPTPLSDETIAHRAAVLCLVAEETWKVFGGPAPVYIIGTEVPTPGGALEPLDHTLEVTDDKAAEQTIRVHKKTFESKGLEEVWQRVIGLVVQPGVEFDHHNVAHYKTEKAKPLSSMIEGHQNLLFEAHSTDYQSQSAYRQLVEDHFAILKVGPALTFALREALFALADVEQEWIDKKESSDLKNVIEEVMTNEPIYWQRYYDTSGKQQYIDRHYSLSDRIRYYWPNKKVKLAVEQLFENLVHSPPPITLLSQYLPNQSKKISNGDISSHPKDIVLDKIMEVTNTYSQACHSNT
ncbi:D-tagatose-bisphosphate aldolase, class II, non-catalytic subunit [Vibrio penaeicida]|uniref:Tagatose-bisphosphate aldolase subunit KbaZ n=1 Tax=Vibrio penaeicida TaxID=104609 RepID=A0AAV5NNT2_9VIBR|nr:D-tagatose-bisphosphate aldolase, class II, non-catalytic subunit [Vibrio penaeicida]RTZ21379.1 D-tagatose-bisphosphate aldolase, class II, non-catalytic subunit [Vibrio penaeicida]GLQ72306.1 tagatose-bisphosphate aldolase subunit KbaZ [Vibrio penaeicida]